jgi:hypothetical protein
VIASQNSKDPIKWSYDNEQWVINNELTDICVPLFSTLFTEGKPIFREISFDFLIQGKRFRGRIDDVRMRNNKIIIRDYKSGKPWMGKMKLNNDPQLTLYNIGLCSLCSDDKFAEQLGMLEKREQFMGRPLYINPEFVEEFFMVEAPAFNIKKGHSVNILNQTTRRDEHFLELFGMINGIEKAVSEGEIYPERGRKCDYCDMKVSCEKRLEKTGTGNFQDKNKQEFFSFMIPAYARDKEKQKDKDPGQKKIRYRFKK